MDFFEITAKLVLDTGKFEESMKKAEGSSKSFASQVGSGIKTAITVGAEAITAATAVVAGFGKAALDASVEYETAFAQVRTIMDTSQMSVEDMSDAIKELSSQMGVSTTELSDTVYNAISATGDTANAVALAEKASKLATAGFTDTSSALSVLTTAMNAYGMTADEAEDISNSLIMVQNLGVTTVSELSSSMGKAIASASAYGVNLSNLESAYVSITKAGINTAEGTTYISSMLKELGDSGSDVSEVLKNKTGKSFDQLMAEGKTLGDVLGVLYESVDGDSTALMNLWSSAEAGKASSAIVGQGLEAFNDNLKAIENSTGATQAAYDIMADTFEHKTDVIGTSWTNFMASMGDGLNSLASENGGILDMAIGWIDMLQKGLENDGVKGVIAAFKVILKDAVKFITDNLPMLLDMGVELIGALVGGLVDSLPQVIDAILLVINNIVTKLTEPDTMNSIIATAIQIINALMDGMEKALPMLLQATIQIIVALIGAIIMNLPQILELGTRMLKNLMDGFWLFFPEMKQNIITLLGLLWEEFKALIPKILETGEEMIQQFVQGIQNKYDALMMKIAGIIDGIITWFKTVPPKILELGKEIITKLINGITNKVNTLRTNVVNIATNVLNWFKNIPNSIATVGSNIITGLWNGINSKVDWIKNKILGFSNSVLSTIKSFFGIASPSKVFKEVGGFMAEGLGIGWDEEYDGVKKQIEDGLTMDITSNVSASSQGTAMNEELELMREQNQLLQQLLQKEFGIASSDLFRSVRESAKTFEKSTGLKAFT